MSDSIPTVRTPIAEDFDSIRAGVERLEAERRVLLTTGLAVQPRHAAEFRALLAAGSFSALSGLIYSYFEQADIKGPRWKLQANMLTTAVLRAQCWLRDGGYLYLTHREIQAALGFDRLVGFTNPDKHPDLPMSIRSNVLAYLNTLPGFREELGQHQSSPATDEHSYLQERISNVLTAFQMG